MSCSAPWLGNITLPSSHNVSDINGGLGQILHLLWTVLEDGPGGEVGSQSCHWDIQHRTLWRWFRDKSLLLFGEKK